MESIRVTVAVLDRLSWMLLEAGQTDLIPALTVTTELLRDMQEAASDNPSEFREFAVPTTVAEPSDN